MKWKPMCLGGVLLAAAGALAQCLPTYKFGSDIEVVVRRPGRLFSATMGGGEGPGRRCMGMTKNQLPCVSITLI